MAWLFENIIEGNFFWTVPLVFLLLILDIASVYYIKRRGLSIKNKYFELHDRFGFLQLNFLKILFAALTIWQGFRPVNYNPLGYFLSILIYTCIVIMLLRSVLKIIIANKR